MDGRSMIGTTEGPMKKRLVIMLAVVVVAVVAYVIISAPKPAQVAADIRVGEEVSFPSQAEPLAASFLKPAGSAARLPAVVMVVGSGSYSYRSSWRPERFGFWKGIGEAFLAKGYAVLFLEKRGVNGSGGHWAKQSFADRAADVHAALDYLRSRPDIDGQRVGVCGHSQGGWVAQLAAVEYPDDVDFIVCLAGANVSVRRQILDDMESEWRCAGLSEDKVRGKVRRARFLFGIYGAVSRVVKVGYLARILNYDPQGVAGRIRCPILAVYGENDRLVPPAANARLLGDELTKAGHRRHQIVIVPGANHGFQSSAVCFKREDLEKKFATGFLEAIAAWEPF
jgi:dienelactone hydrolase